MSFVNSALRNKFESLPIELKNEILSRDVRIESMEELIAVLEEIANENSAQL